MRTLILMIVAIAFMTWFGINYRDKYEKPARFALTISFILAVFVLIGFFRLL
ncbi:MAG: hypothetical protein OEZ33_01890 [Gammaproteobacteria bacterium]|nr:hypothetical protein [Gammaproteobacteria bacterium]